MNVSELARQLKVPPQRLLVILPEFGYDIGVRAVKIDDRVAEKIKRDWRRIKYVLDERERKEKEEQKRLEKEARQTSGASVSVPVRLTVRDLADRLGIAVNKLIVELMKNGILATQNENIDRDTAVIIAEDLGYKVLEESVRSESEDGGEHLKNLVSILQTDRGSARPPVVVVMGHVDHGKTKLLDAIRKTDVAAGEAGGITQHIGAYQVVWIDPKTKAKKPITFIDTPGHEAFTVMRSRGAKVADIAILVVAADDGVKPQTVEAINIIKAAKLPVVAAINKIDKEGADPQRARTDLSNHGIIAEDWGGEVPVVEISAKQGLNIEKLLDTLLLVADVNAETITANPDRPAAGTVIEAHLDKGEGPVATVLVQTGTLKINDPLVINGEIYGKVRAMRDYRGEDLKLAPPSCPARVLGFKVAPQVGDVLDVQSAGGAKTVDVKAKRVQQSGAERHTAVTVAQKEEAEAKKYYNVLIKADTLGSLEAIIGSLDKIKNEEVGVQVVGKGLGNVTADDAAKAAASQAIIYAFNVSAVAMSQQMMQDSGVELKQYKVIYDLLDNAKAELKKLLNPEVIITELGNFKVVAIFRSARGAMVLGGRVENGKLVKDCKVRVKRGGEIIGQGKLTQLQTGKQAVSEVPAGTECGVQYEGKLKAEEGDVLEAYAEETKEKKLVLQ